MTNTTTQVVAQATSTESQSGVAHVDDFDDEVEGIVDVLPSELERKWLNGLDGDPWIEENEMVLRVAFWDAAREVLSAMLVAGYTLTPPKS